MFGNYEKGLYNQFAEVMARLESVEKLYKKNVKTLNDRIDELTEENKALRKENKLLKDENARLKSIINNDSSNTSLPPSTDQKGGKSANAFNGRSKTGRKAGGQKGHPGTTLTKSDIIKKIESGKYKHKIQTIGVVSDSNYITKYVVDLSVEPIITEIRIYADEKGNFSIPTQYRSDVTYGENVKALAVSLYSEGVMSNDRIASFLNSAGGGELCLSEGSVYSFCRKFEEISKNSIEHLNETLSIKNIVATDATTVTINGKQNYIRNFSNVDTVVYNAMKSKSIKSLKDIDFLNKYAGTLIHDHETALYHFGTDHAECNVHIIRYLRKNSEEAQNKWSEDMIKLLSNMNKDRKELISKGSSSMPAECIKEYEEKYFSILKQGDKENKGTTHKYAKMEEAALIRRMRKYSHNHLLFLHDFSIPFNNNISERDLRKAKNRQKMAGGFRKEGGHKMYCSIMTIVETLKKRNMGLIENIRKLFIGTPAIFYLV